MSNPLTNPYVGPRPFERQDRDRFFGRDQEASELLSLIIANRTVVLYAQSGAGKTSLLNAQVAPLLEAEGFEILPVARVQGPLLAGISLEQIPNLYVFHTLLSWAGDEAEPGKLLTQNMVEALNSRSRPTDEFGDPLPRVLIFDQFEELFTSYPARWQEREGFFNQINSALNADSLLRVVFSMREDYIAELDGYADLLPKNLRARFRLERMRPGAALTAVRSPLQATPRAFAPGVAEQLVEDLRKVRAETITGQTATVIGEFIEPVQLQVVCQNLWDDLPADVTTITQAHLHTFGNINQALASFYERALWEAAIATGLKEQRVRQWFGDTLITPAGTRGTVYRGATHTGGLDNRAIDLLEDRHVIRGEWRAGARWYELTHDRLIEPIQQANRQWEAQQQAARARSIRRLVTGVFVAAGLLLLGFLSTFLVRREVTQAGAETTAIANATFMAAFSTATVEAEARATGNVVATSTAIARATAEAEVAATGTRLAQEATAEANNIAIARLTAVALAATSTRQAEVSATLAADSTPTNPATLVAQTQALFGTMTTMERIAALARLFRLSPGPQDQYDATAAELFFGLSPDEQAGLIGSLNDPGLNAQDVIAVIQGIVAKLPTIPEQEAMVLLDAIVQVIEASTTFSANERAIEILLTWRDGLERIISTQYPQALADFELVLEIVQTAAAEATASPFLLEPIDIAQTAESIKQEVCSSAELYQQLYLDRRQFPLLSAKVAVVEPFAFVAWPTEFQSINQKFGANPQSYAPLGLPGNPGLDIMAPAGSNVFAVADGIVSFVESDPSGHPYGIHIHVQHRVGCQTFTTVYAHLQEARVTVGDVVTAGQLIALADNTGNSFGSHLGFDLWLEGATFQDWPPNTIDPTPFMAALLDWTEPAGPYTEGWAFTEVVLISGELGQVLAGGLNLRRGPGQTFDRIGFIPEGTVVFITGESQDGYILVRVSSAAIEAQN